VVVPSSSDGSLTTTLPPALQLAGIDKRFGSVLALHGADFVVRAGTLHALLGENGAGKSTLMAIASGQIMADAGTVQRHGSPVRFASPLEARAAGIGMVHQHSTAIDALTVAENVALAAGWPVSRRAVLHARVRDTAARAGLPLDPAALVAALGVALKQRLEIVKALASDATLLLLDEPAAVLAPAEAEELLRLVRAFCARGGSAVLITHKLTEALAHADDITVLRRGRMIVTGAASTFSREAIARAMIGEAVEVPPTAVVPKRAETGVALTMTAVSAGMLRDATLEIRAGEIVGIAAVEGNGQRELLRCAAGVMTPTSGTIHRAGVTRLVPEDRVHEALIGGFTLVENTVLGAPSLGGADHRWALGGRVRWDAAAARTAALMAQFDVRASGPQAPVRTLSGGNQQKLVLGRALAESPALLVVEQPTRGLDFAATAFVQQALRDAAARGAAVLLHAGDLDEVLALATRVLVLHAGRLHSVPDGADRDVVGRLMLGQDA